MRTALAEHESGPVREGGATGKGTSEPFATSILTGESDKRQTQYRDRWGQPAAYPWDGARQNHAAAKLSALLAEPTARPTGSDYWNDAVARLADTITALRIQAKRDLLRLDWDALDVAQVLDGKAAWKTVRECGNSLVTDAGWSRTDALLAIPNLAAAALTTGAMP